MARSYRPLMMSVQAGGCTGWKDTVFALVERGGSTRMVHIEGATKVELQAIIRASVARKAVIMSD